MLKSLVALALLATPAFAEFDKSKLTLESGVSSLGGYVAPIYALSEQLSLRSPIYFGSTEDEFEVDGTTITGSLDTKSIGFVADYAPFGNGFFVSGGLQGGGYKLSGDTLTIDTDFGPVSGDFDMTIEQKTSVVPVASLGYRHKTAFGLTAGAELGAKIGKYEAKVAGLEALSASDLAAVQTELDKVNDDLSDLPVLPFLTLSVGFGF